MRALLVIVVILLTAILLSGCAGTTPIATDLAPEVSADRILSSSFLAQASNTGEVIIKRDIAHDLIIFDKGVRVFVDSRPVADLKVEEKVTVYLPEGYHIISACPNDFLDKHFGGMRDLSINVKSGERYMFRVRLGGSGERFLWPTTF
jgi:hypothetical protein